MSWFHRHKWRVERKEAIDIERRYAWESEWHSEVVVARIDRCGCGRRRGWLISAQSFTPASIDWLESQMSGGFSKPGI